MIDSLKKLPILMSVALILATAIMLKPTQVFAAAKYATCANTYLETWDWPGMLRASTSATPNSGAGLTNFDRDKDSYLIYKTAANATANRNIFTVVYAPVSGNNKMSVDSTGGGSGDKIYYNGTIYVNEQVVSEPNAIKAPSQSWAGTPGGSWNGINDGTFAITGSTSSFGTVTLNNAINCVAGSNGIQTSPGWAYDAFIGAPDFTGGVGTGTSQTCAALDVTCILKQTFQKVGNTFVAVGQAILDGIAKFFSPDGTQIKSDFDSLTTFMEAKLGFIAYPFTFIGNFFSAFSDTSNNWCTTASCTKNFGSLFGHAFVVDFNTPQTVYPTLWTWIKTILIGLTVLELLLAVFNKYKALIRH